MERRAQVLLEGQRQKEKAKRKKTCSEPPFAVKLAKLQNCVSTKISDNFLLSVANSDGHNPNSSETSAFKREAETLPQT